MRILKSQHLTDDELLIYALSLSAQAGDIKDKLLHWDFGPIMNMSYSREASNYLFSDEKVPLHWDGAFFKEPRFLLFYCTQSEGQGGATLFSDTEKVWESLSESEKEICRKITLVYRTQKLAHYGGEIRVPLVQNHPVTGRTILRMAEKVETELNPVSLEIQGIENTDEFYDFMIAKLYHPDNLVAHEWSIGDLLICDNYTYLHGRRELGENKSRSFKRIQIL